jgi:hypothetical protein
MAIDRTNFNALVDDDGSNTVGTLWIKDKVKTVVLDPIDAALATVQTTTSTGTVNNFALTAACTFLRCNNATLLTLTGLTAGTDGQRLTIRSVGAGQVDLADQAAGSTAANRIVNGVTGTISLAPGSGRVTLEYDATTARWIVVTHTQGAWIAVAYASGNFTANGAMTWTVDAGDQVTYTYCLHGRTLIVAVQVNSTTVGGTLNNNLLVAIPGGFTAARTITNPAYMQQAGSNVNGFVEVSAAGTTIALWKDAGNNWAASTNGTNARFELTFEVQ